MLIMSEINGRVRSEVNLKMQNFSISLLHKNNTERLETLKVNYKTK